MKSQCPEDEFVILNASECIQGIRKCYIIPENHQISQMNPIKYNSTFSIKGLTITGNSSNFIEDYNQIAMFLFGKTC